jgi:soluble lytic murein transglycosylase
VQRLRALYPLAYWEQAFSVGKETGIDPYLLLAMARQESVFQPRIESHAGARGLMQVMPATAAWLAKVEPAVSMDHAHDWHRPEYSLRMGAYYMVRMIERSAGNLVYAVASYNAGPGNVSKWQRRFSEADLDEFIDSIPFEETRDFVRKVLGNYAAYHSLYGVDDVLAAVAPR